MGWTLASVDAVAVGATTGTRFSLLHYPFEIPLLLSSHLSRPWWLIRWFTLNFCYWNAWPFDRNATQRPMSYLSSTRIPSCPFWVKHSCPPFASVSINHASRWLLFPNALLIAISFRSLGVWLCLLSRERPLRQQHIQP